MSPERETKHQGGATSKKFNSIRSTNSFNSNSYKFLAGIIYNVANLILEMHLNLCINFTVSQVIFVGLDEANIIAFLYWQLYAIHREKNMKQFVSEKIFISAQNVTIRLKLKDILRGGDNI